MRTQIQAQANFIRTAISQDAIGLRPPWLSKTTYMITYRDFAKQNQFQPDLKHSYQRHERDHSQPVTVARAVFVGVQFAAGRPILAVILLDQHRDPFAAHVERFPRLRL